MSDNISHKVPTNNTVAEQQVKYGFIELSETEKLKEDIFRPDEEKLHLFTQMLKRNLLLNKASVTHK